MVWRARLQNKLATNAKSKEEALPRKFRNHAQPPEPPDGSLLRSYCLRLV